MLCPNCKTELVEVNGRYICSDCGKEIPENEVMTSDWGSSEPAASGIYGNDSAATPEAGSAPANDFSTSLTESENAIDPVEKALEEQQPTEIPSVPVEQSAVDSQSVEQVLAAEEPPVEPVVPAEAPKEDGFYTAPATEQPSPAEATVPEVQAPAMAEPVTSVPVESIQPTPQIPEAEPVQPIASEIVAEQVVAEPTSEAIPDQPMPQPEMPTMPTPEPVYPQNNSEQVVKDMFEDVPATPVNDPNLYAAPTYDNQPQQPSQAPVAVPTNGRLNLLVLIIGALLVLGTIGGGTWAYIALTAKAKVDTSGTVTTPELTWQEFQIVDGGFKISFPGTPEKSNDTQAINGANTSLVSYSVKTDDYSYSASFAPAAVTADKLESLVSEIAAARSMTAGDVKVGKYYNADAADFTLSGETASYQGKVMLYNGKYILILAGSETGASFDFNTFIKSFKFVTTGSTN